MPLIKSGTKRAISTNIGEMIAAGHPQNQAVAAALDTARRAKMARGGSATHEGAIVSHIPGRTDKIPMDVKSGSFVIPADIVSGLGQGNTLAGSRVLQQALGGHAPPRVTGRPGHLASGGVADDGMPVQLSGGEFLVTPEIVASIGGGDPRAGAAALDQLVAEVRNHTAATLPRLPGPK